MSCASPAEELVIATSKLTFNSLALAPAALAATSASAKRNEVLQRGAGVAQGSKLLLRVVWLVTVAVVVAVVVVKELYISVTTVSRK